MEGVSEYIDDCNQRRKMTNLIMFDDMIADILKNKKFQAKINYLLGAEKWIFHLFISHRQMSD